MSNKISKKVMFFIGFIYIFSVLRYNNTKDIREGAKMAFTRHEKSGMIYYTSPLFDSFGVPHFFCTRSGGVSRGAFESLNFSSVRKDREGNVDAPENIRENLKRVLELFGTQAENCAMMKQVHSAKVKRAISSCKEFFDREGSLLHCDGIFADGCGIDTVCVKTADCVPILLYDVTNNIPCAIHAGWRGSVADIAGNAVREIKKNYPDAYFIAAIGPCIRSCCYEVSKNVVDGLLLTCKASGIKEEAVQGCIRDSYIKDGEEKFKIELAAVNRMFLENAGVKGEDISDSGICTCCDSDEFFSHRAWQGFSGTQISGVRRKPDIRNDRW